MKFVVEAEIDDELIEELAELQGCSKEQVIEWFRKYFGTLLSKEYFGKLMRAVLDIYGNTEDIKEFEEVAKNYSFNFGAEISRKVRREVFGDDEQGSL